MDPIVKTKIINMYDLSLVHLACSSLPLKNSPLEMEAEGGNEQFYDSRVRDEPGPGAAAIVGRVDGPNVAGQARETIKAEIESSRRESARPVLDQKMPRPQREHAQQYFDIFREGED